MKNSHSESYAAAGVDVTAGYESVERIKPMVESTYIPRRHGAPLGGFGGMFAPDVAGMKSPCWSPAPTAWAPSSPRGGMGPS